MILEIVQKKNFTWTSTDIFFHFHSALTRRSFCFLKLEKDDKIIQLAKNVRRADGNSDN